jgi:hypothetical protein
MEESCRIVQQMMGIPLKKRPISLWSAAADTEGYQSVSGGKIPD